MRAYCLRCKAERSVVEPEQVEKRGNYFIKGKCLDCGSMVAAKGRLPTAADGPGTMDTAPLFRAETIDFGQVRVYRNRVEFMKSGFLSSKTDTIPMRSISEVSVSGFMQKLHIRTMDGKQHAWTLKKPNASTEARDLIASLL